MAKARIYRDASGDLISVTDVAPGIIKVETRDGRIIYLEV